MSEEPDAKRLEALEQRLAAARKAAEPDAASDAERSFSQAQYAWRMVVELVVGIGIGVGLGYGLDVLFGTRPWLLVVFTLFGFAAGVNVMLETAREMGRAATGAATGKESEDGAGPEGAGPDEKRRD